MTPPSSAANVTLDCPYEYAAPTDEPSLVEGYPDNPNRIPELEQRLRRSRTRDEGKPSGFSLMRSRHMQRLVRWTLN